MPLYLPESDRRFTAGVRLTAGCDDVINSEDPEDDAPAPVDEHVCNYSGEPAHRVQPHPPPYLSVHCNEHCLRLTLDTGAEVNLIRALVAACTTYPTDGLSLITVADELAQCLTRGAHTLTLQALMDNFDVESLTSGPVRRSMFMPLNDVLVRPAVGIVSIGDAMMFCNVTAPIRRRNHTKKRNEETITPAHGCAVYVTSGPSCHLVEGPGNCSWYLGRNAAACVP